MGKALWKVFEVVVASPVVLFLWVWTAFFATACVVTIFYVPYSLGPELLAEGLTRDSISAAAFLAGIVFTLVFVGFPIMKLSAQLALYTGGWLVKAAPDTAESVMEATKERAARARRDEAARAARAERSEAQGGQISLSVGDGAGGLSEAEQARDGLDLVDEEHAAEVSS